ncbi:restriction endonuclease subunit S [Mycoplasma sp. Z463D]
MKSEKLVPNIRFKGFTNTWEKKKLSDISQIIVGKVVTKKETNENGNYPIISGGIEPLGYLNKYNQVKDTVTVGRAGSAGNVQYQDTNFWLNDKCFALKSNSSTNDYFLYSMLLKYQNDIQNLVTIGTLPVLNSTKLKSLKLKFTATQEQKEIAEFFKALNELLTFYKRKSEKLENLKKSLLEKMFVSDGEQFPAIRFKGFTNTWEKQKLKNLGNVFQGLTNKTKDDFGYGDAKYIPYLNVFNNPITDNEYLEKIGIDNKQNQVKFGDILFTVSSETPEEVGMSSIWLGNASNIYLNSFCFGFRLTEIASHNLKFLAYYLRSKSIRKYMNTIAQGISRYNISKTRVLEMNLVIPEDYEEQSKIGAIFNKINELLTLHKRKCEKLENIKQFLLEKMFC